MSPGSEGNGAHQAPDQCRSAEEYFEARNIDHKSQDAGEEDLEDLRLAEEERDALGRIVAAMQGYKECADQEISRWQHNYARLPPQHRALLPHLASKLETARHCVASNDRFLRALLAAFDEDNVAMHLSSANAAGQQYVNKAGPRVVPQDEEKVRYVLKNVVRDWSADGAVERAQSYGRILAELRDRLGPPDPGGERPLVIVPGAGLGRLCLEVAALGYRSQGNEFSYYMLLSSSFMLNQMRRREQWVIHPWVLSTSNHISDGDQMHAAAVPDILPAELLGGAEGLLSMCAGDFVEVYGREDAAGSADAVVTCFFVDTAHNVIEYLQVIRHVLKDGGVWINLGPLLWHWADAHTYLEGEELSLELSLEDVVSAAMQLGFRTLQNQLIPAGYLTNSRSMLQSWYKAAFWTMVKSTAGPDDPELAAASDAQNRVVDIPAATLSSTSHHRDHGSMTCCATRQERAANEEGPGR